MCARVKEMSPRVSREKEMDILTEPQQKIYSKLNDTVKKCREYLAYHQERVQYQGLSYLQKRVESKLQTAEKKLEGIDDELSSALSSLDREYQEKIRRLELELEEKKRRVESTFELKKKELGEKVTQFESELQKDVPQCIIEAQLRLKQALKARDAFCKQIDPSYQPPPEMVIQTTSRATVPSAEPDTSQHNFMARQIEREFEKEEEERRKRREMADREIRERERQEQEKKERDKRIADNIRIHKEREDLKRQDEQRKAELSSNKAPSVDEILRPNIVKTGPINADSDDSEYASTAGSKTESEEEEDVWDSIRRGSMGQITALNYVSAALRRGEKVPKDIVEMYEPTQLPVISNTKVKKGQPQKRR